MVARRLANRHKKGQTLVEYGLIVVIVSIVAIAVLISLSNHVETINTVIMSNLANAGSSH